MRCPWLCQAWGHLVPAKLGPGGTDSPHFCMGQDCLWDSEEQNGMECIFSVLLLAVPEAVLSHTKTRSRSAVQFILSLAPRCPRGSLVPFNTLSWHESECGGPFSNILLGHARQKSSYRPRHWKGTERVIQGHRMFYHSITSICITLIKLHVMWSL